ncbi:MAG: aminopeptidase N [Candidatus Nanopelagicales bacterium]
MTSSRPSLTRDEAQERTRLLSVSSYDVELDLTRGDEVAGSRSTIAFGCLEPGASTFVEISARRLLSASLNGVALPADAWDGYRLVLTGLAEQNVVVVEAEVEYARTGDGLYREVDPEDGETYVGAYVGVVNAQLVFACFDQPDLKARIGTRVTAPVGWTVVGNGQVVPGDPSTGLWELAATPPVSPYLFALVAGPLAEVRSEHRGIPMALYARRAIAEHLERESVEILDITRRVLDRCLELFDEPYPFDKLDLAFVPGLVWGALEQVGCVLLRDEYVFTSEVTDEQRLDRANTIAHEVSHMWFGDLMTLHWWDDVWLNESFAEYMGARLVDEATDYTGSWERFGSTRKPWGYAADDRPSTHPVAPHDDDVVDTERALENFDGISYAKGAAALQQLVAWLGDDVFLAGVNDLITARRFGTATLEDLLAALSARSGRDVEAWADAWLRTSGHDTLRVERVGDAVSVAHSGDRPHLVMAGLYDRDPSSPERLVLRDEVPVRLEPGETRTAVPSADAVLVCHRDLTFASVRYDEQTESALAQGLSSVESPLARLVVWNAWNDQVRHAESSPVVHLERVERHLSQEADALVVDPVLDVAQHVVVDHYLDAATRAEGSAALRRTCRALLATAERTGGQSLRLVALRGLVGSSGPDDVAELRALLEGTSSYGPVDDELRWRVAAQLAGLGELGSAEIDAVLAAAPTQENAVRSLKARAALPDPAAKEQSWRTITGVGADAASTADVRSAGSGFWVPGQDDLLAEYVPLFLPAVVEIGRVRGAWVVDELVRFGWPWHRVDSVLLAEAETLAADPARSSSVRRHVGDAAYDYRLAHDAQVRWLS